VGNRYAGKTIDQCIPDDPICSTSGSNGGDHGAYAVNGMTAEAAAFAANSLVPPSGSRSPVQNRAEGHP
jgi:cutinase